MSSFLKILIVFFFFLITETNLIDTIKFFSFINKEKFILKRKILNKEDINNFKGLFYLKLKKID